MNTDPKPCRTTQHCAYHGWCRRCDPGFAAVMSRVNAAIQRTDADESHWGPLYEAVAGALRGAPPVSGVVDWATLRDRIAEALYAHNHPGWAIRYSDLDQDERGTYLARADAVLVVLQTATLRELEQLHRPNTTPSRPELRRLAAERVRDAADRSRLLLWAADRLERMPGYPRLVLPEELLTELRRLAAEPTANTETVRDDYERTTGHLITCLAVAGGGSDPDCPVCHPPFGVNGCTCIPFTRQGGVPRYCGPADTVDMISGWERRSDCPHHKPAVVEQPDTQETRPALRCNWAHTRTEHLPHDWEPQPGMDPVNCPGYPREADPVVAWRSLGGRILRCLNHVPPEPEGDFEPVTSEDLPDGGICTYPDCGVDVLIAADPAP